MPVRRVHLPAAHDGPLHFQQTRGRVHPLAVVERAAPLAARAVEDGQPAVRAGVREQFRLLAFVRARGREEPRLVGLGAHGAAAPHQDAQRVVEHVRAAVAVARGAGQRRPRLLVRIEARGGPIERVERLGPGLELDEARDGGVVRHEVRALGLARFLRPAARPARVGRARVGRHEALHALQQRRRRRRVALREVAPEQEGGRDDVLAHARRAHLLD
mmetsp:Transcript_26466/g.82409  ORF Transcript_26466/g.82409 Transcript_26466/m.82409 type:complete len:217 (-) Transcript_26466:52-702(-)